MSILKGNPLVKGISGTYKRKLAYYGTFFRLMYVNLIRRKFFVLKFLELHQLSQDMLFIELVLIYFENFDFLVYHIRYLHSPDVV